MFTDDVLSKLSKSELIGYIHELQKTNKCLQEALDTTTDTMLRFCKETQQARQTIDVLQNTI